MSEVAGKRFMDMARALLWRDGADAPDAEIAEKAMELEREHIADTLAIAESNRKELRDRFAMAALPLVVQLRVAAGDRSLITPARIATDAYIQADAMLAERDK